MGKRIMGGKLELSRGAWVGRAIAIGLLAQLICEPESAWAQVGTGRGLFRPETMNPAYNMVNLLPPGFKPQVTGLDSLSDGSLVVSTREDDPNTTMPNGTGKIYLVKGIRSYSPSSVSYKVIADGLTEAMGVAVVNDTIYTLTPTELIRYADVNKDGTYETKQVVCKGWPFGGDGFEWAFGLVYKGGAFYGNLSSASSPETGGQNTERGAVIKMKTDNTFELLNTGIRRHNGIGLGPNQDVFITDNQGEYVPACRLVHSQKGQWYGYQNGPEFNPRKYPLGHTAVWMEWWAVARSPTQPSLLIQGPYAGQMITGDNTDPSIRRIFLEKVGGEYQGAVFHWATMDKSPANRFLMSKNGDIIVGGLGSFTGGHADWNWSGGVLYGLQVLRPTGVVPFDMLAVRAVQGGFDIEFTKPVGSGAEIGSNYEVKTWSYISERRYDSPAQNEIQIYPSEVRVGPDRKRVFLAFSEMIPGNVVYFRLGDAVKSQSNDPLWSTESWYTLNTLSTAQPFTPIVSIQKGSAQVSKIEPGSALRFDPVSRLLSVDDIGGHGASLSIRTLAGKTVYSTEISGGRRQLLLSPDQFPSGIYLVAARNQGIVHSLRISIL